MPKIKLTKGELKRQRENLVQFEHYLPTLQLKKQQLQLKVNQARKALDDIKQRLRQQEEKINAWVGLLADPFVDITPWITPLKVIVDKANVAGADIPVFEKVEYKNLDYDYYLMPLWIDEGIYEIRKFISLLAEREIQKRQIEILQNELRITTQRVNLFEKVKIPEAKENIRVIRIYLGDQQANMVGISKVAKKKIAAAVGI